MIRSPQPVDTSRCDIPELRDALLAPISNRDLVSAAELLSHMPEKAKALQEELIDLLQSDAVTIARCYAAQSLANAEIRTDRSIAALREAAADSPTALRESAAWSLARLSHDDLSSMNQQLKRVAQRAPKTLREVYEQSAAHPLRIAAENRLSPAESDKAEAAA